MNTLFPGTFDPFTFAHLDILNRSLNIFPIVYLGIIKNDRKNEWFSPSERKVIIKNELRKAFSQSQEKLQKIRITSFHGPLVDLIKKKKIHLLIRGLRNIIDFQYESNMSRLHFDILGNNIETLFFLSNPKYNHISSTLIKELIQLKADTSLYISKYIQTIYQEKCH